MERASDMKFSPLRDKIRDKLQESALSRRRQQEMAQLEESMLSIKRQQEIMLRESKRVESPLPVLMT